MIPKRCQPCASSQAQILISIGSVNSPESQVNGVGVVLDSTAGRRISLRVSGGAKRALARLSAALPTVSDSAPVSIAGITEASLKTIWVVYAMLSSRCQRCPLPVNPLFETSSGPHDENTFALLTMVPFVYTRSSKNLGVSGTFDLSPDFGIIVLDIIKVIFTTQLATEAQGQAQSRAILPSPNQVLSMC